MRVSRKPPTPCAFRKAGDVLQGAMLRPGLADAERFRHADAVHARQLMRLRLDDVENARSEGGDQPLRDGGADALQEAGAEKALQVFRRGRRCGLQHAGAELNAVVAVVQPFPARFHDFADGDRRRMADNSHRLAMAACLDAQHAEAGLVAVERHPLDRADEMFGKGQRLLIGSGQSGRFLHRSARPRAPGRHRGMGKGRDSRYRLVRNRSGS